MASGHGGWWQLLSIGEAARAEREFYASQPPMACPRDGEPLTPAGQDSAAEFFCRFDGFRYPEDWDATSMSGM